MMILIMVSSCSKSDEPEILDDLNIKFSQQTNIPVKVGVPIKIFYEITGAYGNVSLSTYESANWNVNINENDKSLTVTCNDYTSNTDKILVLVSDGKGRTISKELTFIIENNIENSKIPASVDLGLSVNWSAFNWGATCPWEYGDLYGWGAPASNSISSQNYPNLKNIGDTEYDVIACDWGNGYRMPTDSELNELMNKCYWSYITFHNVKGYKVTGPNGNSIFIPAAGYFDGQNKEVSQNAFIWSSDQFSSRCGSALHIHKSSIFLSFTEKYMGLSLRGVTKNTVSGTVFVID